MTNLAKYKWLVDFCRGASVRSSNIAASDSVVVEMSAYDLKAFRNDRGLGLPKALYLTLIFIYTLMSIKNSVILWQLVSVSPVVYNST